MSKEKQILQLLQDGYSRHKPGDKRMVDRVGTALPLYDKVTGDSSKVYLFAATLPFSMYDSRHNNNIKRLIKNAKLSDSSAFLGNIDYLPDRHLNRNITDRALGTHYYKDYLMELFEQSRVRYMGIHGFSLLISPRYFENRYSIRSLLFWILDILPPYPQF